MNSYILILEYHSDIYKLLYLVTIALLKIHIIMLFHELICIVDYNS